MGKIRIVCDHCGSDDVVGDAAARWDVELQKWEVSTIYDKGHHCGACDRECKINEEQL